MGSQTRIVNAARALSHSEKILLDRALYLVRELKEARSEVNREIASLGVAMGRYVLKKVGTQYMVPTKQKELAKIRVRLWGVCEIEDVEIRI